MNYECNQWKRELTLSNVFSEGYCSAKSFRAFMDRNFLASCQTHDACYSISNRDKNECDKQFKENLEVLCEKENIAFCDAIIWAAGYATGHKGFKGYFKRQGRYNCHKPNRPDSYLTGPHDLRPRSEVITSTLGPMGTSGAMGTSTVYPQLNNNYRNNRRK